MEETSLRLLPALTLALALLAASRADALFLRGRLGCRQCVYLVAPEPVWYGWGAAPPGAVIVPATPPCQMHVPYPFVPEPVAPAPERTDKRDKNESSDKTGEKPPAKKEK
jgi:hypothetical protein